MASSAEQAETTGEGANVSGGYTAIVHFHGMGSQRRLEETARMVDALDKHQRHSAAAHLPIGKLLSIEPRLERRRDPLNSGRNESFIRATWKHPTDSAQPVKVLRFYEVYWAPLMADGKSVTRTLKWVLSQLWRPIRNGTTPWRERQRLRRATLMEMNQSSFWTGINQNDKDIERLAARYDAFERLDALERWPKGYIADFYAFIRSQFGVEEKDRDTPETVERLVALTRRWRIRYWLTGARTFLILTTMMLAAALAAAGLFFGVLGALRLVLEATSTSAGVASKLPQFGNPWQIAGMVTVALASGIGITRFLTDAVGDVETWSTYAETDAKHRVRKEVLACGTGLLTHILADPACTRVVITAHSLGTAIAQDTLLALARGNRASNERYRMTGDPQQGGVNLKPIEHLVTFGSPIDKIEYFFESSRSQSHRYRRVVENLRGDIGEEPFLANTRPHIHWINVWDDADLVSGSLQSPTAALPSKLRSRTRNLVDNVHVEGFAFPDPVASHIRYLRYRSFVAMLFGIIVHRERSFAVMTPDQLRARAYGPLIAGPGSKPHRRIGWQLAALALPWIIAVTWLLRLLCGIDPTPGIAIAVGIAVLLAAGFAYNAIKGPQEPI
jgi:hypothetical protein